jgi:hypothetical protein
MHRWAETIGETLYVPMIDRYLHRGKHRKPGLWASGLHMMSLFAISM